jgi:hypothetical protein
MTISVAHQIRLFLFLGIRSSLYHRFAERYQRRVLRICNEWKLWKSSTLETWRLDMERERKHEASSLLEQIRWRKIQRKHKEFTNTRDAP